MLSTMRRSPREASFIIATSLFSLYQERTKLGASRISHWHTRFASRTITRVGQHEICHENIIVLPHFMVCCCFYDYKKDTKCHLSPPPGSLQVMARTSIQKVSPYCRVTVKHRPTYRVEYTDVEIQSKVVVRQFGILPSQLHNVLILRTKSQTQSQISMNKINVSSSAASQS